MEGKFEWLSICEVMCLFYKDKYWDFDHKFIKLSTSLCNTVLFTFFTQVSDDSSRNLPHSQKQPSPYFVINQGALHG